MSRCDRRAGSHISDLQLRLVGWAHGRCIIAIVAVGYVESVLVHVRSSASGAGAAPNSYINGKAAGANNMLPTSAKIVA